MNAEPDFNAAPLKPVYPAFTTYITFQRKTEKARAKNLYSTTKYTEISEQSLHRSMDYVGLKRHLMDGEPPMTPEEFTEQLPPFGNESAGSKPPFMFKNLSVRIFPLRANLDALQQVCDSYLNFVPPEVGRFRASIPYAYLALLDYGQISGMVDSVGWFSQAEVYFGVPVEWYQAVRGRWVFRHWAVITPFIYVDDDFSAPLGRSVFGYPKTLAKVTNSAGEWLKDPTGPVTLARVETRVFLELYTGKKLESRVFLEVERAAPMSNSRFPPDPRSPMAPWSIAMRFAESIAGFGRDAMRTGQFMRIFEPNPASDPSFVPAMLECLRPALMPDGKGLTLNSVNLKQFRSADDPLRICFQALTTVGLQMMAFNGSGLLGEERTTMGDLTGGHCIKLYEYPSLPIVQTLGLEVSKRWRGDGVDAALLKPVMPFWANLNVKFLQGTSLAWRTSDGIWHRGNGKPLDPFQQPVKNKDESPLFNTTVSSSVDDAITGPFEFDRTTIRVLPLLADRAKLEEFLDDYINKQLKPYAVPNENSYKKKEDIPGKKEFRLALWARPSTRIDKLKKKPSGGKHAYVYATATAFGEVTSKTNDVGDWANYELSFLIPVRFESREWQKPPEGMPNDEADDRPWETEGVGLVPVCTFVDDITAAISRTEVLGIQTLRADFVRPASAWLEDETKTSGDKQTLLQVKSEVFTALHAGQKASIQPLFEISLKENNAAYGKWDSRANPDDWAELQRSELRTKNATALLYPDEYSDARSLALEILGNRVPVALYTLKQFRDVADPGKACYQALVRVSRAFEEVIDLREDEEIFRVRLHDFPTLPLVNTLGIVATTFTENETGVSYETQAVRPFYIRAKITEEKGEELLSRSGTSEWKFNQNVSTGLLGLKTRDKPFWADANTRRTQDEGDPCRMNALMVQSGLRRSVKTQFGKDQQLLLQGLRNPRLFYSESNPAWRRVSRYIKRHDKDPVKLIKDSWTKTKKEEKLKELKDLESRRDIEKEQAIRAFLQIDPQMVIESILSREWGNRDENAHWRLGRKAVLQSRELVLFNQSRGLESLKLEDRQFIEDAVKQSQLTASKRSQTKVRGDQESADARFRKRIQDATRGGRELFLEYEKQLYMDVLDTLAQRQGRRSMRPEVEPRITRMSILTRARLEMEGHFTVLTAWSISQRLGTTAHVSKKKLDEAITALLKAIRIISTEISESLHERWPYSNSDVEIVADTARLSTLLNTIQDKTDKYVSYQEPKDGMKSRNVRGVTKAQILSLIAEYREAVALAMKLCNAQRGALIDKLARAYQKPDFCVRRDSVDHNRETVFPLSLSWDDDWYAGEDMEDMLFEPAENYTDENSKSRKR